MPYCWQRWVASRWLSVVVSALLLMRQWQLAWLAARPRALRPRTPPGIVLCRTSLVRLVKLMRGRWIRLLKPKCISLTDVTSRLKKSSKMHWLATRPGMVKSRDQLIDAAYGDNIYVDDRTIDSHIKRVRRKFREVDGEFEQIETLYGIGYRYRDAA